jgi:4-oxalocrotonate tautomerase
MHPESDAMPILTVLLGTPPDTMLARQVADDLLGLTADILGKPADLTSVAVQFVNPAHRFIGGQAIADAGKATAFVEIRITDETNTKAQKARWIAAVHAALTLRLGPLHDTSYVQVQDVRAAALGFGGRTQEARLHLPVLPT